MVITIKDGESEQTIKCNAALIATDGALSGGLLHCAEYMHRLPINTDEEIRTDYIDIIVGLADKYSRYIRIQRPDKICPVVDVNWEPREQATKNTLWKANIRKSPKTFRELTGYEYVLNLREYWIENWTNAQLVAAIMSQLLRIDPSDGSVLRYAEDTSSRLVATFGEGYLDGTEDVQIPDLLEEDVELKGFPLASGQITMEELE